MSKGEIAAMYREARKKKRQITILAQLNQTSEKHIKDILTEYGYLPRNEYRGKGNTGKKTRGEKRREDGGMAGATAEQTVHTIPGPTDSHEYGYGSIMPESVYCAIMERGTVLEMERDKLIKEKKRIDAELADVMNKLTDHRRFVVNMAEYIVKRKNESMNERGNQGYERM